MHFQMLLKNNAKNLNAFGGAKIILNFKNKSLKKQSISILQENPATHRLDIEKNFIYSKLESEIQKGFSNSINIIIQILFKFNHEVYRL